MTIKFLYLENCAILKISKHEYLFWQRTIFLDASTSSKPGLEVGMRFGQCGKVLNQSGGQRSFQQPFASAGILEVVNSLWDGVVG